MPFQVPQQQQRKQDTGGYGPHGGDGTGGGDPYSKPYRTNQTQPQYGGGYGGPQRQSYGGYQPGPAYRPQQGYGYQQQPMHRQQSSYGPQNYGRQYQQPQQPMQYRPQPMRQYQPPAEQYSNRLGEGTPVGQSYGQSLIQSNGGPAGGGIYGSDWQGDLYQTPPVNGSDEPTEYMNRRESYGGRGGRY